MPIESGRYIITHAQYHNSAFLSDANDGTSLLGCLEQDGPGEEWNVKELRGGRYSIVNFGNKMSASAAFQPQKGEPVVGREKGPVWLIKEHGAEGKYTIATANDKLRWWLDDNSPDTPITLNDAPPSDLRCHWTFQKTGRVKASDEAREHKATLRSYFNMMSQLNIGDYTIKNVLNGDKPRLIQASLFWAAEMGHDGAVQLILAQDGVDVNFKTTRGGTPLHLAADSGHDTVVRLLLAQKGVDVNSKLTDGITPLHMAASHGHDVVVRLLLAQKDVDVNPKNMDGVTPLYSAASYGHDVVVQLLLARNDVDVNSRYKNGATPLLVASKNGHDAVVRLLLTRYGVDVNLKIKNNATPLHIAAYNGHEAVVQLLLGQDGVDINFMDDEGKTPLMLAEENKHETVARLLREKIGWMGNAMR